MNLKPYQKPFIAFSGGIDSTVLAHLAKEQGLNPTLIHVNHNLQAAAGLFENHCKAFAKEYGLTFISKTLTSSPQKGDSIEAFAREARYRVFQETVGDGTLLVAQHADDQAETFLLQLLRGAGPNGLSAMPCQKQVGQMTIERPLLRYTRKDIEVYAKEHNLNWVEDPSNHDLNIKRNALRHEVLPVLAKHFPDYVKTITRSAQHCADADMFIQSWVEDALSSLVDVNGHLFVKSDGFQSYSNKQQNYLIRGWLKQNGIRALNQKHLSEIHKLIQAEHWGQAFFKVGDVVLKRDKTSLYLVC